MKNVEEKNGVLDEVKKLSKKYNQKESKILIMILNCEYINMDLKESKNAIEEFYKLMQ